MDDQHDDFEARIREELEIASVPEDVDFFAMDAAVLEHIHRGNKRVWLQEWMLRAAAVVLVAGGTAWWFMQGPPAHPAFAREDLNRDGAVDIVDAFVLAQRIQRAEGLEVDWDFNADGSVDGADVRLLSQQVVELDVRGQG